MGFFAKLLFGDGTLKPEVRAELEAEGLVLIEENLRGSVRYDHFRAAGRRHHGKVTGERIALGISERRLAVYCRSGRAELIDSPFNDPRVRALEPTLDRPGRIALRIDYDDLDVQEVSGQVAIRAWTSNAREIVDQLNARVHN